MIRHGGMTNYPLHHPVSPVRPFMGRVLGDSPMPRGAAAGSNANADHYAVFPIEGTQVVRDFPGGAGQAPVFAVRCCCGFKAGPYGAPTLAEDIRASHESACLWPKS
jgi:hypothetical protein